MIIGVLRQIGIGLLIIVLGAAVGAAIGYATVPRYTPPGECGEERLRERAEEFYRAMQVWDFGTMAALFTPARQLEQSAELSEIALERSRTFMRFKPETRTEMLASVATINAGELDAWVEGDWAVTGGYRKLYQNDEEFEIPLSNLVWVKVAGDWWVYKLETCEIVAYGQPPDFARQLLVEDTDYGLIDTSAGNRDTGGGDAGA